MITFELQNRQFGRKPQKHQLSTKFQHTFEEVFETLDGRCGGILGVGIKGMSR